jgi:hypothetical protein
VLLDESSSPEKVKARKLEEAEALRRYRD